ncbi:MAG: hypothetical protein JOZ62_23370 [Acidobacteriaceae bacterium]|nr:hypothetical protein [Acidobacteriaceae bacterium]
MSWLRTAEGALILLFVPTVYGQDTRHVAEPHPPPPCTVLSARLSAPNGTLPEADERKLDTNRIQSAIDNCGSGKAVELKADGQKNIFLAGPFQLKPGVTLSIDANTALFASRDPKQYELSPGSCGIVSQKGRGCRPLITADNAPGSGIMGDGVIDGRGGENLLGQNATWWDLAKEAKVKDLSQSVTRLLVVRHSDDFTLYRITMRNSPNFHVAVDGTNGFTAWGVKIQTPKTARNTDGIDPSSSTNVTITHCDITTGDDNVAIKTGAEPASHMTIAHNHFYSGHGMSIGSGTEGGVSDIRVSDLSIEGADNGIRIKSDRSRGGLVQNVVYEDVCMRNVTNPIVLTPMYTTFSGNKLPVYRDIVLRNVHSLTPGWLTFLGLDAEKKLEVTLDGVFIDGEKPEQITAKDADIRIGPAKGSISVRGQDVTVRQTGGNEGAPVACEARFPAFPSVRTPQSAEKIPPEDKTLYVAASGTGDYYSVQRAIDVAPAEGAVISVAPGTYRETLNITKPNITIRSAYEDASKTVIVNNKSAGDSGGTFKSSTVNVTADNFMAESITFANDFNATHPQVPVGSQALALLVTGDRAIFRNVRLLGNQDTVYAASKTCRGSNGTDCQPARQYFANCYIEGNVDFIFGDGKAFFDHCTISNTPHQEGFITAQGKHYADEDSAFVFDHCKLTAARGVKNVWLGRPWRPFATVIFLNTEMGAHIEPAGWREWHPGETHYLDTVFYAEYNSTGPGAHPNERDKKAKHLSASEAAKFDRDTFLAGSDGWKPAGTR